MNEQKFAQLSKRLIEKSGRQVILQKYNEFADWKNGSTPIPAATLFATACFLPASGNELGFISQVDDLLKRSKNVMLLAPQTMDVRNHHAVLDGQKTWKIEWVEVLQPANEVLLYVVGLT